jgi:PAS domain S-box-containing protein
MSIVYNLERYQKIFEQAVTPIYMFDPETKHLKEANTSFTDLLGYTSEEIKTLTLYDFILHKKESIDENIQYLLTTGAITIGERIWRRKDKTLIDVLVTAGKLRLEEKDTCFVMAYDINERKQVERELKKSKEILENITQGITEDILLLSKDLKILWANKTAMEKSIHDNEKILGNYCYKAIHHQENPSKCASELCPVRELQKTGKPSVLIHDHFDEMGNKFFVEVTAYPIKGEKGEIDQFIHVSKDITKRKQNEKELIEARDRLQTLSKLLLQNIENERRQITRELHDDIGQELTLLRINLQNMCASKDQIYESNIEENIVIVDRIFQQIRDLSSNLRPAILDDLGMIPALRWYINRLGQSAKINIRLIVNLQDKTIPAERETVCFRVVQEALTNIVRHAKAQLVTVELMQEKEQLKLAIRDDGIGFDLESSRNRALRGESFGLLGMQERVTLIGGSIEIESVQGRGTKIKACFPLK